jgi:hypothetical protein
MGAVGRGREVVLGEPPTTAGLWAGGNVNKRSSAQLSFARCGTRPTCGTYKKHRAVAMLPRVSHAGHRPRTAAGRSLRQGSAQAPPPFSPLPRCRGCQRRRVATVRPAAAAVAVVLPAAPVGMASAGSAGGVSAAARRPSATGHSPVGPGAAAEITSSSSSTSTSTTTTSTTTSNCNNKSSNNSNNKSSNNKSSNKSSNNYYYYNNICCRLSSRWRCSRWWIRCRCNRCSSCSISRRPRALPLAYGRYGSGSACY